MKRIKLVENFLVGNPEIVDLKEKTVLQEKSGQFTCFAVLKRVPVSRYTENKNGRIYGRNVWEAVKRQGSAEGTYCLADHPEDDGSVKNIVGVWKNLIVEQNMVYGDLWLIEGGHGYGVLFYNAVRAGGKCGLSSVGYGELDPYDNKTVLADSYELVRLGDWVMDPSQSVFASFENLSVEEKPLVEAPIEEAVEEKKSELKEETEVVEKTNFEESAQVAESPTEETSEEKKEDMEMSQEMKEATMETLSEVTKIHEAHIKNQVKSLIRESRQAGADLVKIQRELQETIIPSKMTDLKEQVQTAIEEIGVKLEEQVKSTQKSLQEKDQSFTALKEKYGTLKGVFDKLKEKYETLKETNATLVSERAAMLKDLEQFSEDRKLMESDIEKFTTLVESYKNGSNENSKKIQESINELKEDRKLMEADIKKFMEERELMEKDIKMFEEDRANMLLDIKQLLEDRKGMEADIAIFVEERKAMQADIDKLVEKVKEFQESDKITGYNKPDGKDEVTYSHSMAKATAVSQGTDDDNAGKEKKAAMSLPRPAAKMGKIKESAFAEDLDELHSDVDEEGERKSVGMKENSYSRAIKEYYVEQAKKYPGIKDFEKHILQSRSLTEAMRKIDSAKEKMSDAPVRLSESKSKFDSSTDFLGDRY